MNYKIENHLFTFALFSMLFQISCIVKMREKLYVSPHLIFLIHLALEGDMLNHPKGETT